MKFNILTLFPNFFNNFLNTSIIKKALLKKKIKVNIIDIRKYSLNKHKRVDMPPVSGGAGLIMKCQPIIDALKKECNKSYKILLSPRGKTFNEKKAKKLSSKNDITIICGHYEGIDERVNYFVDELISIGDFILTGGEIAAMAIIDSITRLLKNVISPSSLINESFNKNLLEYPQYTEPYNYQGYKIPDILYSGNHEVINKYNRKEQLRITKFYRSDLFKKIKLNKNDLLLLKELKSNKTSEWEKQAIEKAKKFIKK